MAKTNTKTQDKKKSPAAYTQFYMTRIKPRLNQKNMP